MTHAQYRKYKPPKRQEKSAGGANEPVPGWLTVLRPWLPVFLFVLLLAAGMQGWRLLQKPGVMPFKDVQVTASYQHISRQALQEAIMSQIHAGFFAFDVSTFKQRLQERLPWIESVVVRRVWPSTLKVTVVEQKAVAIWNGQQLVNSHGQLFGPAKLSFPAGLPQLVGPASAYASVLSEYSLVAQQLQRLNISVKQLALTDRQAWHLMLSNGVVVMLGRERVNQRLARFVKVYPELLAAHPTDIQSVDLRYPNGFAIK